MSSRSASPRRFEHTVAPGQAGQRLDAVVAGWLTDEMGSSLSKSVIRKIIMAGAVRLNGRPVRRPGLVLQAGTMLDARIDPARLAAASARRHTADDEKLTILYEDEELIAIAKPAGLVMHATADPRRDDLFNAVRRLLTQRSPGTQAADSLPYLGLHHRLDVDTSGIVLFTKRERANTALAGQFAQGDVTKVYHAIVGRGRRAARRSRTAWRVENRLAMSGSGRSARMEKAQAGGTRAVTEFEILDEFAAALLIEARPETGRKHQIRAHLSAGGMPILGDTRYGGPTQAGGCTAARVMLHASRLSLLHPVTGARLDLTCPYPRDFTVLLDCLRRRRV